MEKKEKDYTVISACIQTDILEKAKLKAKNNGMKLSGLITMLLKKWNDN